MEAKNKLLHILKDMEEIDLVNLVDVIFYHSKTNTQQVEFFLDYALFLISRRASRKNIKHNI